MSSSSKVTPSDLAQPGGVRLGGLAGREARHRERVDVGARAAEPVHRLGRDDQRVRRVEAAADADDDLRAGRSRAAAARARRPGCCRPRSSRARAARGRRARTGTGRPCGAARCHRSGASSSNSTVRNAAIRSSCGTPVVVEGALPQPVLADPVEVDVDDRAPRPVGEPLGSRPAGRRTRRPCVWPSQDRSVVDSPWPGGREDVRRDAARAGAERTSSRRSSARATVIGLPDRLASTVAPASAASALGGTGTHMSSQISTCSARPGTSVGREDQVGAERHLGPADRDGARRAGRRPGAKWRRS